MTISEYRIQLLKQHTDLVPDPAQEGWLDDDNVDALADVYRAGADIPPIVVVRLPNGTLQIFEGHHRYEAAKVAGVVPNVVVIPATWARNESRDSSREDVEWWAVKRFEKYITLTYQRRKESAS